MLVDFDKTCTKLRKKIKEDPAFQDVPPFRSMENSYFSQHTTKGSLWLRKFEQFIHHPQDEDLLFVSCLFFSFGCLNTDAEPTRIFYKDVKSVKRFVETLSPTLEVLHPKDEVGMKNSNILYFKMEMKGEIYYFHFGPAFGPYNDTVSLYLRKESERTFHKQLPARRGETFSLHFQPTLRKKWQGFRAASPTLVKRPSKISKAVQFQADQEKLAREVQCFMNVLTAFKSDLENGNLCKEATTNLYAKFETLQGNISELKKKNQTLVGVTQQDTANLIEAALTGIK